MRVNAINSSYNTYSNCKTPNFNGLIKDKTALPIIKNMSKKEKAEFKHLEKRFSKTKYWDIKIFGVGSKPKDFKFNFVSKKDCHGIITDGIYPYDRQGNTIKFYSIIYGPENTSLNNIGTLSFKSEERAAELYDKYHKDILYVQHLGYNNISPLQSLKLKEVELNMLEESSEYSKGKSDISVVMTKSKIKKTTGNDLS